MELIAEGKFTQLKKYDQKKKKNSSQWGGNNKNRNFEQFNLHVSELEHRVSFKVAMVYGENLTYNLSRDRAPRKQTVQEIFEGILLGQQ